MKNFFLLALTMLLTLQSAPIKTPQHVFSSINPFISKSTGDYPLPTDMTFRHYADHSIDASTEYFDPDIVRLGDTIYIADWYLAWFIKHVHPKISYPYILISNDSDSSHPDTGIWDYNPKNGWAPPVETIRTLLYDSKIAAWFCKNLVISRHPKLIQIPIGQNIVYWSNPNTGFQGKEFLFQALREKNFSKDYLLFMCMQLHTNPIRIKLAELFKDKPYCFYSQGSLPNEIFSTTRVRFYNEISQSIFTLAPPGYGPDTVRFWEAILFDSIPIVKHFELDDLYADLPVLFVHDWEEINEDFLKQKYQEIQDKHFSKEKAYFDFWLKKIQSYQQAIRNQTNQFSYVKTTVFKTDELNDLVSLLRNSIKSKSEILFCKGAVMTLRPFELADKCTFVNTLYVQDPWGAWGHEHSTAHLSSFLKSPLFKTSYKIKPISYYDDPYAFLCLQKKPIHVFLDLSYLRYKLRDDLETAYAQVPTSSLICGNCFDDAYIKEVLQMFEEKYNLKIQVTGNIWYLVK